MIYKHKTYPYTVDIDKINGGIACGYKLDENGKRIPDGKDAMGNKAFKRIITMDKNLVRVDTLLNLVGVKL
jgi:hypothetical protein